MEGCIDLSQDELEQLKYLLDKALIRMEELFMEIKAVKFRTDGFYSQPFAFGGEEGPES